MPPFSGGTATARRSASWLWCSAHTSFGCGISQPVIAEPSQSTSLHFQVVSMDAWCDDRSRSLPATRTVYSGELLRTTGGGAPAADPARRPGQAPRATLGGLVFLEPFTPMDGRAGSADIGSPSRRRCAPERSGGPTCPRARRRRWRRQGQAARTGPALQTAALAAAVGRPGLPSTQSSGSCAWHAACTAHGMDVTRAVAAVPLAEVDAARLR